jgi:hypothetical protein
MKKHPTVKQMGLFSIQTVIGDNQLQDKQKEIIDQAAVILLNYLKLANQLDDPNKLGDQSCQV